MWPWASRSPVAVTPRSMRWWASSSTPWCCGWTWPAIPVWPRCSTRCVPAAWIAYENQDVPFEVVVERLNPTRSLTHHPLVQVMLAWQNLPSDTSDNNSTAAIALGDLAVTQMPVNTGAARMDLSFSLAERWSDSGDAAGIGGSVEFRTDVFDAASVEVLIGRLRAGVDGDDCRSGSAVVLGGCAGRWLSTPGWMSSVTGRCWLRRRPVASVPALFAEQVARAPEAVALTCGDRSWTYRELDEASNRLAHLLIGRGAGPGRCVAVLLSAVG